MEYYDALIIQRADPQIYKHINGIYYFTGSHPDYDRIILRGSETIEGLATAEEITIWTKHSSGEMSHYIWAPEIHYIDGEFVIYFAAKASAQLNHTLDAHQIYVLRLRGSDPLKDPWVEEGRVDTGWKSFSLDGTTFSYQGSNYFVWAQMRDPEESNSNIYIAKMKNFKELELPAVCLTVPELDWECVTYKVNEGPAVVFFDGKVHLTYSASATDHNYCIGLLTMTMGEDPLKAENWKKSKTPIFSTNKEKGIYGPGHNSFTYSEDDEEVLMVFHARDYMELIGDPLHDPNRHARVLPYKDLFDK